MAKWNAKLALALNGKWRKIASHYLRIWLICVSCVAISIAITFICEQSKFRWPFNWAWWMVHDDGERATKPLITRHCVRDVLIAKDLKIVIFPPFLRISNRHFLVRSHALTHALRKMRLIHFRAPLESHTDVFPFIFGFSIYVNLKWMRKKMCSRAHSNDQYQQRARSANRHRYGVRIINKRNRKRN